MILYLLYNSLLGSIPQLRSPLWVARHVFWNTRFQFIRNTTLLFSNKKTSCTVRAKLFFLPLLATHQTNKHIVPLRTQNSRSSCRVLASPPRWFWKKASDPHGRCREERVGEGVKTSVLVRVYLIWNYPPASHQDEMTFLVGNPCIYWPSSMTGILGGG